MRVKDDLSEDEFVSLVRGRSNWSRWGVDDQLGALNLITPEKRVSASKLISLGETYSLSRPLNTVEGRDNPIPAVHVVSTYPGSSGEPVAVVDTLSFGIHGQGVTHLDALCHVWNEDGMWGGRDPEAVVTDKGVTWGGIENWRQQLATRCVLVDIPALRGEPYVTNERPVLGSEIVRALEVQNVELQPGDALAVYSGRDAWNREQETWGPTSRRPGLHASCFEVIAEADVAVLMWDMMDAYPTGFSTPWTVHAAICSLGVAVVDNCLLEGIAAKCREIGRYEFFVTIAPLVVPGGTGSPVNPLAIL
jgi:kynurenine formamidase